MHGGCGTTTATAAQRGEPDRLRWPLLWIALGTLAGALAGCAGFRAPRIEVLDATVVEVTDEAMRVDIALDLSNPNAEPLELREITYAFTIDGTRTFSGKRSAQATLPSTGTNRLNIPAVVRWDRTGWEETRPDTSNWSVNGSVVYLVPSPLAEILLDINVRKPRAPFRGTGTVALP
jgi:LEA14-like dessication related protein